MLTFSTAEAKLDVANCKFGRAAVHSNKKDGKLKSIKMLANSLKMLTFVPISGDSFCYSFLSL